MTIEKRVQATAVECRANEENNVLTISGYAVRYNEESELLEYGFREIIKPNSFTESLKQRNILALHQHDDKQLLASTKAKTLRLEERVDGIYFEMDLLETRKDLYELVKRGDLSNMSFGFTCDKEKFTRNGDTDIREVMQGTLYEVSLVHTPAYPTSSVVAQRSLDQYKQFKEERDMTGQAVVPAVGIGAMAATPTPATQEVRTYSRGEKLSKETAAVSLGGLIRAYVTGKGSKEEREMLTTTNTGSFLVPHQIMSNMIDLARDKSFLFGNATIVNMGGNQTVSVPKVISDPTVAFKKPGAVIPKSDPTFGEIKLDAKYMYGLVEVPLELVKTGIGIEEKLNYLIATAMNQTLEKAALYGATDGFKGIFNDTEILHDTIVDPTYLELKKGVKAIATNNHPTNDLVLSPNNLLDIETIQATDGQFITPPSFYTALNKFATNALDDSKILLGDLSSIYIGMLQDVSIEVSTQYGFDKGTLAIRIMWYGDVVVSEPKKLCLVTVGA
ncbi:phage major capsid protein [Peribacillus sp. NPDC097675]|uniref:phage major capsid protein n=1 Tax=Peribacillus sp. NPDC097675 TaxID=3390618 RepID=UPI003D03FF04